MANKGFQNCACVINCKLMFYLHFMLSLVKLIMCIACIVSQKRATFIYGKCSLIFKFFSEKVRTVVLQVKKEKQQIKELNELGRMTTIDQLQQHSPPSHPSLPGHQSAWHNPNNPQTALRPAAPCSPCSPCSSVDLDPTPHACWEQHPDDMYSFSSPPETSKAKKPVLPVAAGKKLGTWGRRICF